MATLGTNEQNIWDLKVPFLRTHINLQLSQNESIYLFWDIYVALADLDWL